MYFLSGSPEVALLSPLLYDEPRGLTTLKLPDRYRISVESLAASEEKYGLGGLLPNNII